MFGKAKAQPQQLSRPKFKGLVMAACQREAFQEVKYMAAVLLQKCSSPPSPALVPATCPTPALQP